MILHLHVPGFYAAVEQADQPALRGCPLVVGGDPRKGGTVTSASVEALRMGVREGDGVRETLQRWSELVYRPTRLRRYREVDAELGRLLRSVTDRIEPQRPAGYYLQVPRGREPLSLAAELCVRIQAELRLPAVAGLGATRFVAHLAAHEHRAGEIRQVSVEETRAFLARHPVRELWGVGTATADRLAAQGVRTIGELQALSVAELEGIVGRSAPGLLTLARGEDREPLRPLPSRRSISQERTLEVPSRDLGDLADELGSLAARLEALLHRERRAARSVRLGVVFSDGAQVSRSRTLADPLVGAAEIAEVALELLRRTDAAARPCRRLRLQLGKLARSDDARPPRQLRLF